MMMRRQIQEGLRSRTGNSEASSSSFIFSSMFGTTKRGLSKHALDLHMSSAYSMLFLN